MRAATEDSMAEEMHLVSLDLGGGLILWSFPVQRFASQLQGNQSARCLLAAA